MIWPLLRRAPQQRLAVEAPAVPFDKQAIDALERLRTEAAALSFLHVSAFDAETRGQFLAAIERILEVIPAGDWMGPEGEAAATSIEDKCATISKLLSEHELAASFHDLLQRRTYYGTAFGMFNDMYLKVKALPPASARSAVSSGNAAPCNFPAFSYPSETLQQEVAQLRELWEARMGQRLSVEDRYFLEATANSYLPEAVSLLTSLRNEPKLAPRAEKMFGEQVALLRKRMLAIEDQAGAERLDALKVHGAFLQERVKLDAAAKSQLTLRE